MTIDFKLNWEDNILQPTMTGYNIEMNPVAEEIPIIDSDPSILLGQTQALLATINQGQLAKAPNFGIDSLSKQRMNTPDIMGQIYTNKVLEDISNMLADLFNDNYDLLIYASTEYVEMALEPINNAL